ncbi:proline-rich protein HaeIII subfamily 1-like [Mesocricetus auratus]|uniref:Proline-rich protein HaeIII subfamily 1-like n=1 Tax=Mesocricetus auratus TaxID=10036 RepID=A0ABM2WCE9_MESAU|nr:proline-rich protein HaeIII subfamily 1-like [Mesocricetus auratus]
MSREEETPPQPQGQRGEEGGRGDEATEARQAAVPSAPARPSDVSSRHVLPLQRRSSPGCVRRRGIGVRPPRRHHRPPFKRAPPRQVGPSVLGRRGWTLTAQAPPPASPGPRPLTPRPRLASAPAPRTPPPTPPRGRPGTISPDPRGHPQPRAPPLTWPRAPGPPSLGDQRRSPGPSRRHLVPTPSALRLRPASRTCDLKGAGQRPSPCRFPLPTGAGFRRSGSTPAVALRGLAGSNSLFPANDGPPEAPPPSGLAG